VLSSISVLQWLLNAETSHPTSSPPHRLNRFFTTLHSVLRNPSRAVLQFYPSSDDQIQLITSIAQKAGFGGGIVVDFPNSNKARKVFLVLMVGSGGQLPKGLEDTEMATENEDKAQFEKRRERARTRKSSKKQSIKVRDWILNKKEVGSSYPGGKTRQLRIASLAVQTAWEGECASRFKVHRPQAQSRFLKWPCSVCISPGEQEPHIIFSPRTPSAHYFDTKRSLHPSTASTGPFRMNVPCRAAILTRLPIFISVSTIVSSWLPKSPKR
jgi:Methyltransferase involved in Williams-Beuren syndrome